MPAYDADDVLAVAADEGYALCQRCDREGVLAFRRELRNVAQLVRVWHRTGTVGTYLKHPSKGKTQLYRRRVEDLRTLRALFDDPRCHTHDGYQRRVNASEDGAPCRVAETARRTAACPACGKMFGKASNAVGHYESGGCPTCRDESRARRNVHAYASAQGAGFLVRRIGRGGDSASEYATDDDNYRCNACGKEFARLGSLIQHQEMRVMCRYESARTFAPRIAYDSDSSDY